MKGGGEDERETEEEKRIFKKSEGTKKENESASRIGKKTS